LADRRPKDLSDENGRRVMKGRSLVVVLGLILATLATVAVLGYPLTFDDDLDHGRPMVGVVVSKVDIPAGTDMDRLIKDDQFRFILVLQDAAVDGAVTSVDQLSGRHNSVKILAGEQIPVARIWSVGAMRQERLEFLG
jgi:Flp pilus assembly protein CpaB